MHNTSESPNDAGVSSASLSCNSATATNCPSPLLPVGESLRGYTAKGKPKRKSAADTLTESFGAGGGIVNAIGASIYHKSTVVNQDVNSGHLVVGALAARDYKGVGNQYVAENKCVVEQSTYAFDSLSSNSMKSSNPDSGCNEVDVAKTLDTWRPDPSLNQGGIAIVEQPVLTYGIQGNVIGRQPQNGPAGKGHTEEGDPMFTLTGTDIHAVAYDEYNDSINETHHALRAGTKQSTGVLEPTMAVRRLTPLECERLMGWPDDHTRYKADGTEQADTHRYKQCGNGVASPVAEWIGKQLMKLDQAPQ